LGDRLLVSAKSIRGRDDDRCDAHGIDALEMRTAADVTKVDRERRAGARRDRRLEQMPAANFQRLTGSGSDARDNRLGVAANDVAAGASEDPSKSADSDARRCATNHERAQRANSGADDRDLSAAATPELIAVAPRSELRTLWRANSYKRRPIA